MNVTPAAWVRCARCFKKTRQDRAVQGFGRDCAARLGLTIPAPRVRSDPQDGPDLFDAFDENARETA